MSVSSLPPVELHIDLEALRENYRSLCSIASPARVAAVVKANAYGLGIDRVAQALAQAGCGDFFVSSLAEGLELRALVPSSRIFVLEGAGGEVTTCLHARLIPVLNTFAEVEEWVTWARDAAAVIQVDTGMTRAGLDVAELERLRTMPQWAGTLRLALLMTHLACADDPEHPLNALQLAAFGACRALWPDVPVSIANSAGIFLGAPYHGALVRPGIALYGGVCSPRARGQLRPVVRLMARILQLRELSTDAPVGYGAAWLARAPARVATVGAGYADGYPRSLGHRGQASVAGVRVPVIGRVSMDLLTLDVSAVPPGALAVGDMVELYGAAVSLEEIAERAGTVNYELLTRLSPRIKRCYRDR